MIGVKSVIMLTIIDHEFIAMVYYAAHISRTDKKKLNSSADKEAFLINSCNSLGTSHPSKCL